MSKEKAGLLILVGYASLLGFILLTTIEFVVEWPNHPSFVPTIISALKISGGIYGFIIGFILIGAFIRWSFLAIANKYGIKL